MFRPAAEAAALVDGNRKISGPEKILLEEVQKAQEENAEIALTQAIAEMPPLPPPLR